MSKCLEENNKLQLIFLHQKESLDDLSELILHYRCQWVSEIVGFNTNLENISKELIAHQKLFKVAFDHLADNKTKLHLLQKDNLHFSQELETFSVIYEQNLFYMSDLEAQELYAREDITVARGILHNSLRGA